MFSNDSQLKKVALACLALILFGVVAFSLTEKVSPPEALYDTAYIVLTHHDNFHIQSAGGRITVIILVLVSLILVVYLLKWLAEYMMGLGDGLKRHQVKSKIAKLDNHYIVCGLGRVGSQVADELATEKVPFVAVDRDEEKVKMAITKGYIAFVGDSTDEEILKLAAVERARGLVAALGEDSHNLFVTLAARQLNSSVYIVARSNREENKQRLVRAGADRIAMPYQIGGYHMATMTVRPHVVDFLDVLSGNKSEDLQIEELELPRQSRLVGEKLSSLARHKIGATVLAINSNDGESKVNPNGEERLYGGDKLIIMGTRQQLNQITEIL